MIAYQRDLYRIRYLDNASFQPFNLKLVSDNISECEISRNSPYIRIRPSYDFSNFLKNWGLKIDLQKISAFTLVMIFVIFSQKRTIKGLKLRLKIKNFEISRNSA